METLARLEHAHRLRLNDWIQISARLNENLSKAHRWTVSIRTPSFTYMGEGRTKAEAMTQAKRQFRWVNAQGEARATAYRRYKAHWDALNIKWDSLHQDEQEALGGSFPVTRHMQAYWHALEDRGLVVIHKRDVAYDIDLTPMGRRLMDSVD